MARFQVFANPDATGCLLDVQSDFVDVPGTRVVVPLLPALDMPPTISRLLPVFTLTGSQFIMATHLISAVPSSILRHPVADLALHRDEITAALDLLFQGF